jgi:4-carboxymuconolactone decarboxylase
VSRREGLTDQQLEHLADYDSSPAFSDLQKRVLRYAEALTQTPANVSQELFDSLRDYFTPQQIVELTSAIAWENFRARFNRGFGIEAEGFMESAACPTHFAAAAAHGVAHSPV